MRNIAFALLSAAVAAFASAGEIVYEDPAARSGDVATPRVKLPCNRWLYASGLPHGFYSRDRVHSSELGKQLIGRVMLAYLTSGEGE